MNQPSLTPDAADHSPVPTTAETVAAEADAPAESPPSSSPPQPSYVKLAMRNMVRKRGTSLYHFALTTVGLLAALVGLAYLTR